jgi:sialate O-acetylesterase
MKLSINLFATCYLSLLIALPCSAQVRLPQLISDGMVLQREARVNIWGWAAAGEKVTVKFMGKSYRTTTPASGKWTIVLNTMKAGGPYIMDITASNHIVLKDILLGDVWFCSGQSNMVIPMERVKEKYAEEIANADYPQIRNFLVPTISDVTKIHEDLPPVKWMTATPENVPGFGAVTYFFAKKIYSKYHVPIGIINASVGGTPIQAWISEEGIKQIPQYANRVTQLKDTAYLNQIMRPAAVKNSPVKQQDKGLTGTKTWYDPSYIPEDWHSFWLPGYWADQGVKGLRGVVWFRKEIDLPQTISGKAGKLMLGRIVDADQTYVNGKQVGNITYKYPPRRYEIPAGLLKPGKNVIVIRLTNTTEKGGFVPDKQYNLLVDDQKIDLRGDWIYKVGQVFAPTETIDGGGFSAQNEPAGLYNTMVAPAIDYTVKGILWYQGEANTGKPQEYAQLLSALITDWRSKWHKTGLPFIYAQLPNFMDMQYTPSESQWAELREAQLKTLSVPNTGMAVAIDAGEWNDIHPLNKKDVGERLALAAEPLAYGEANVVSSGPLYQTAKIEGHNIVIAFSHTGSGLVAKGNTGLKQFAIAGADKKFIWANASIEGDKVIVSSDDVPDPLYVRYAWADNPQGANLYNKEGLPASPFRTDR